MLLIALALAAQPLPDNACTTHPVGWMCKASWIATLPQRQQRTVLILLRGGLNLDVQNRLIPNVKTDADACWALGVSGYGNAMLAMAATKNADLRSNFGYSSEIYRRVLEGELTSTEADTLLLARAMPRATVAQNRRDLAEVERLYRAEIEKAQSSLIAFAKVAAQNIPRCQLKS